MRSHRVWSNINAPDYATSKSFGGEFCQTINVGSSSTYSNWLGDVVVQERQLPESNWSVFELRVDGDLIKRSVFNNKTKQYSKVEKNESCGDAIARIAHGE